ncbi:MULTISPECIES: hypothetical protein [unclassified Sinorhizobium]|uniref:hypothetical protein n=1 Tax=unclassified Sinorhizobium TaxID=2613772 RepID=UPI0024C2B56F|nr:MULTISPECIES: hypothetical protein [unclassified Sinorhizobium]MDK1374949.1 hypothetical protein [Sinorhizobium sp. 6-70]MDK1478355.1 hypothetical protein [Sinorhizobium sp. 6-117]
MTADKTNPLHVTWGGFFISRQTSGRQTSGGQDLAFSKHHHPLMQAQRLVRGLMKSRRATSATFKVLMMSCRRGDIGGSPRELAMNKMATTAERGMQ